MAAADSGIGSALLVEARNELKSCHLKIRHCLAQLSDEQVWWRTGEGFNSIGNLLLHLKGNIGQRILSLIGGQQDNRNRATEFAERGPIAKAELLEGFDDVIERADAVLAGLSSSRLLETRRYQKLKGEVEGTVLILIIQTVVHLGGHTQEIVALTRLQLKDRYRFMQAASPGAAKA